MHLLVEAASSEALSRAMQGFSVRVAKGLNRVMDRKGYVRENGRHHGIAGRVDEYASPHANVTLPAPETWLLTVGWRRAAPD